MINNKLDEYFKELEKNDKEEDKVEKEKSTAEIKKIINDLNERKITYQRYTDELEETGGNTAVID